MLIVAILATRKETQETQGYSFSRKRTSCTIRCGDDERRTSNVAGNPAVFNEKFVLGRQTGKFGSLVLLVHSGSSVPTHTSASVYLDLDDMFKKDATFDEWIQFDDSEIQVRLVLKHIPMKTDAEKEMLNVLSRKTQPVNDQGDLEKFGRTLPALWYSIPDEEPIETTDHEIKFRFNKASDTLMRNLGISNSTRSVAVI